jgi:hypothetical protein
MWMNALWGHMIVVQCINAKIRREVSVAFQNDVPMKKCWTRPQGNAKYGIKNLLGKNSIFKEHFHIA